MSYKGTTWKKEHAYSQAQVRKAEKIKEKGVPVKAALDLASAFRTEAERLEAENKELRGRIEELKSELSAAKSAMKEALRQIVEESGQWDSPSHNRITEMAKAAMPE